MRTGFKGSYPKVTLSKSITDKGSIADWDSIDWLLMILIKFSPIPLTDLKPPKSDAIPLIEAIKFPDILVTGNKNIGFTSPIIIRYPIKSI